MSACTYCERRFAKRLMGDEPPAYCPSCGCPASPSLNGPLIVRSPLKLYAFASVTVNGVTLTESR